MSFWDTEFLGNPLSRWATAVGAGVVVIVVMRLIVAVVARRMRRFAAGTATDVDDLVADLVDRTKLLFVLIVALWAGSEFLTLSATAQGRIRAVLILGLLLQTGYWTTALVNYGLNRYRRRVRDDDPGIATAMGAVGFVVRLGIWAIIALIALDTLGIEITALLAGVSVGGIAVALAVQNILGDLFAALSIVLDKPFVVGDYIVVGDSMGTVENVGLKTTRVRSLTGEQLVIGNSDLLSSRIRNYKRMEERRAEFQVGVEYGTPAEKLEKIPDMIKEAVEARENTRFDRSHFKAFGDFALVYETVFFMTVPDYFSLMETRQAINLELYRRFEDAGIEFAFPTQTLHVRTGSGGAAPGGGMRAAV
jgi:small-conductance mechanosensitive channel